MKKSVLIFVKSNDALNNYIRMLKNGHFDADGLFSLYKKKYGMENFKYLFLTGIFYIHSKRNIRRKEIFQTKKLVKY